MSHESHRRDHDSRFLVGLRRYMERAIVRFHTPGHRGGRWAHPDLARAIGKEALGLDVSDVLEGPRGAGDWTEALRRAEGRAASAFGAGATRFLVNGTSGGIHAAVFALAAGGEAVFSRASHVSVYAATAIARAAPSYVRPVYDPEWDIAGPPSVDELVRAIQDRRPDLVVLTYPDYYGLAADGRPVVEAAGSAAVVADEAHGAHFRFCPGAPAPALEWGCSVSVQSTHKMLGALTQASMLHVSRRATGCFPRLERALAMFQTTSASPLLLASLESAVDQVVHEGARSWGEAVELAHSIREAIERETPFRTLSAGEAWERWRARLDPARLVVHVGAAGWTGLAATRYLRERWRVQVEMGNQQAIVVLVTPGNTAADAARLIEALRDMGKARRRGSVTAAAPPGIPPRRMLPWEAIREPAAWVPLEESAGCVAAETVCPYPPGIPVVVPGEEITPEVVQYLAEARARGWELRGPVHADLSRIGVVDNAGVK